MKQFISNPIFSNRPIEYKSITYYRLFSKGYKYDYKNDKWNKNDIESRIKVINPLTNREIYVGSNIFMSVIRSNYDYDENKNKLIYKPDINYYDPYDSDFEFDEFEYDDNGFPILNF